VKKSVNPDRLAVFDEALDDALATEKAVRVMANVIADIMAEFHGFPFRVVIDHDAGVVMVRKV
jgi:hypothetical protein